MPRVVLDTNVFLDCWVFGAAASVPLKAALEARRFVVLRSHETDAELHDVLARPAFGLDAARRATLLAAWHTLALEHPAVAPGCGPLRCTDPDDQKFLDLALAAGAFALFTKDKALLATARRARAFGLLVTAPSGAESVRLVEDQRP